MKTISQQFKEVFQKATDGAMKPDDYRNRQRLLAYEARKLGVSK